MLKRSAVTPRRTLVVHSPHAGRSGRLQEALAYLRQAGIEPEYTISIASLDSQPAQGDRWKRMGIDVAIAAGGDGLVGGVITHIAESGLPLGILPLGTANDIARSLRIPLELRQAASVIAAGVIQEVDIGVARPAEQAPHRASKGPFTPVLAHVPTQKHGYFAHALTVGLNVQFARIATNVATRQRFGRFTYPVAALEALRFHEALETHLQFEGLALPSTANTAASERAARDFDDVFALRCRTLQVAVINAPIFGGQWELTVPGASIADRLLDIVVFEELEFGNLNRLLARFFGLQGPENAPEVDEQQHFRHPAELTGIPGIHHVQAKGVVITTNTDPRDVTLDGEVRGQTPLYVHLAEKPLKVVTPVTATC